MTTLSPIHHQEVQRLLSLSGVEKPVKSKDFEGTEQDWDTIWQQSLVLALSTSMRSFNQHISRQTPPDIIDKLTKVLTYLNPDHINTMGLGDPKSPTPTIGDVHDAILKQFALMLDPSLLNSFKPSKISTLFYSAPMGLLYLYKSSFFHGLARVQHRALMAIRNSFDHFVIMDGICNHGKAFSHLNLSELECSLDILAKSTTPGIQQQFADDCYAITSTFHAYPIDEFDRIYQSYSSVTHARLINMISEMRSLRDNILKAGNADKYINIVLEDRDEAANFISSLPDDDLRALCINPGFINMHTIAAIAEKLPFNELLPQIIARKEDWQDLSALLKVLPEHISAQLIDRLGPAIKDFIKDTRTLKTAWDCLKTESKQGWMASLGQAYIISLIHDLNDLQRIVLMLPAPEQFLIMTKLGPDSMNKLLNASSVSKWDFLHFLQVLPAQPSSHAVIATLGRDAITRFTQADLLPFLAQTVKQVNFAALICVVGNAFPKLVDELTGKNELLRDFKQISRAYKFYNEYYFCNYDSSFSDDDLIGSIEGLFTEINGASKYLRGYFFIPSDNFTQLIISRCRETKPNDHESLLAFLDEKLLEIDLHEGRPGYYYTRTTNTHDGEVAMRIMYCIVRLNHKLRPELLANQKLNNIHTFAPSLT